TESPTIVERAKQYRGSVSHFIQPAEWLKPDVIRFPFGNQEGGHIGESAGIGEGNSLGTVEITERFHQTRRRVPCGTAEVKQNGFGGTQHRSPEPVDRGCRRPPRAREQSRNERDRGYQRRR